MADWVSDARWHLSQALQKRDQQTNAQTGLHSLGLVRVTYRVAVDPEGHVLAADVVNPPDLKPLGERFLAAARAMGPLPPLPVPPGSTSRPVQITVFSQYIPALGAQNWQSSAF
jgi:hypothetical protein